MSHVSKPCPEWSAACDAGVEVCETCYNKSVELHKLREKTVGLIKRNIELRLLQEYHLRPATAETFDRVHKQIVSILHKSLERPLTEEECDAVTVRPAPGDPNRVIVSWPRALTPWHLADCDCEFTPYPSEDEEHGEESCHYRRTCAHCGVVWWGLHCPHDGFQNDCPGCGKKPQVLVSVNNIVDRKTQT